MVAQIIALAIFAVLIQVARRERRLYEEHRAEADARLRRIAHQERIVQNASRPRTGQVQSAPRLVPLAQVVPFPLTDLPQNNFTDDGPEWAA